MTDEQRTGEQQISAAIAAQRGELAELLTSRTQQRWDAPTLCAGWRVREVVAHLIMPYRCTSARFLPLALCGRTLPAGHLRGAASARFSHA